MSYFFPPNITQVFDTSSLFPGILGVEMSAKDGKHLTSFPSDIPSAREMGRLREPEPKKKFKSKEIRQLRKRLQTKK